MKFKKTTLPNGLRIVTVPARDNPSVTVMVLVETGSNYETEAQNGLSHFLEHMCFKGTVARPRSIDISREFDAIGAENNAFTSNEMTGYYAKAARKHFGKVLDLVSDLYLNPTLPSADLEKERGVILQEISMYEDLPQRKVHDVLEKLLYGETSFGRPILGPAENIKKFSRADFVDYRKKHYIAEKTIVIVAGDVDEREVKAEVKKYFKNIPRGKKIPEPKIKESQTAPALKIHFKKTDQAHMILSFRAFGAQDKRMSALELLSTILGQGMSSRLFQKMREEMGACYYVKTAVNDYTSYGSFAIATGIEARRAEEVVKALVAECRKLLDEEVSKEELDKAKEHYIGQLYMNLETSDALAEFYADQEISSKKSKTPGEIEKEIRKITPKDVMKVARDIFRNDRLNLAIVGNISDEMPLKKALALD